MTVLDKGLSGGQATVNGTGTSQATFTSSLISAINSNSNLQKIGVTASASGTAIIISSCSPNGTSYIPYTSNSGGTASGTETFLLGFPANGTVAAIIGGTAANNDNVNVTIFDASISGGSQMFTYASSMGTSPNTIASALAASINGASLAGITASVANGTTPVLNITSTSQNTTSYAVSVTGTGPHTDTIALSPASSAVQSVYNNMNELTNTIPGGAARFIGTSNQPLASASVTTSALSLNVAPSTYGESVTGAGSETLTLGQYSNGTQSITVGGTATTSDGLLVTVYNPALSNGMEVVTYPVPSGSPSTSTMAAVASEINADANLPRIGVTAANTSGSAIVTLSVSPTTYTVSTSSGATESLTLGTNINGNSTCSVGGTATASDTVTITVQNRA